MSLLTKLTLGLLGLGAAFLVVSNPNGVFKAAQAGRSLVAGSIVDVTTGGKGRTAN